MSNRTPLQLSVAHQWYSRIDFYD